ncbi:MAG: UvrD-helicase domain-containing protein, partial [Methanospirillum sp.]|uniref:UvrD-helicase domain-containing protein n=1 Tax=Methanospirillum sp. TaxID=45200 RepID=UPI00236BC1ED
TTHDRSLIVTAGAGTGKTHVLVNKYLNLLEAFGAESDENTRPLSVHNILALTFTDKAAAEMKERIRSGLETKNGKFWDKARTEFLTAPVQTFHSFCAQVLREFAFEAKIEPSFVVMDAQESSRILTSSYQDLIHTPGEEEEIVYALATVGQYNLETMIRTLYSRRDEADRFFTRFSGNPDEIISCWQHEISRFRESEVRKIRGNPRFRETVQSLMAFAYMDIPGDDKAMIHLQKIRPGLEILDSDGAPDEFYAASASILKESLRGGSTKVWSEDLLSELKETNRNLKELLKPIEKVSRVSFNPAEPFNVRTIRFLQALGSTFSRFCELVDGAKDRAGGIDFSDLIRYTRQLFRDNHDLVVRHYAEQFRYILVDEFQDTDPAQFEIVTAIAGDPTSDTRSLFIVGDPKQSIYLFREADVTRFRDASTLITEGCKGSEIPLDVCFRSSPAVIGLVNILFSRIFASSSQPFEFPYDITGVSPERTRHSGSVTLLLTQKKEEISEPEAVATAIADLVLEGREVYEEGERDESGRRTFTRRPASWSDIAILLERRTNLGSYLHALGNRDIPYYVHKGTGFYQRQEILDLISLLTFLQRPYDDIALAGLLRSPYFGLSDTVLFRIRREKGETLFDQLHQYGRENRDATRIHALLTSWIQRAGRWRVAPLIQAALDESGVLVVYGGLIEGAQILSNIEKLLEMVRKREESESYQLADLVTDLGEAIRTEDQEGEAMIDDPELDAVRIMTIHAAKGLEFPIVVVPEMGTRPNLTHPPILLDGELMGVRIPDPDADFETEETPVFTILRKQQEEKLLAEKKRLFYVALTRTADHLIMSGEIGDDLPSEKETRLDWVFRELSITGDAIEAGEMTVKSPEGEEIHLRIQKPRLSEKSGRPDSPPFLISNEFREISGRWSRGVYVPTASQSEPLLVTRIVESLREEVPTGFHDGRGADFGTAIHEVLRGSDPSRVTREYEIRDPVLQQELQQAADRFSSLPDLADIRQVKHELAFTVPIGGVPVTGRIDFICQLPDGSWIVIDYKSDQGTVNELCMNRTYQIQLEIYRIAAEMLGMCPATTAIYRTTGGNLIPMNPICRAEIEEIIHQAWVRREQEMEMSICPANYNG